MLTRIAYGDSRLSFWPRVREFAVPPSMIEKATARRHVGDWAGACAAAGIDVDLDLRRLARTHGRELTALVRTDLRRLAPDLLRWHMPRIAPDGLLRPGLTLTLARYPVPGHDRSRPLHLVVRTPPAWADAGQRMSLLLWGDDVSAATGTLHHPHPRPNRRFRLDLHRHLWDARRTGELRTRSGAGRNGGPERSGASSEGIGLPEGIGLAEGVGLADDRWSAEAELLLRADELPVGPVTVRLGSRRRLLLEPSGAGEFPEGLPAFRIASPPPGGGLSALPVLPDAATWVPPDLELLRVGAITADRLHPLVGPALLPDRPPAAFTPAPAPEPWRDPHLVDCRGARHRIGLVDGVLTPLDHDPAEVRREELLAALSGTPLPCLRAVHEAHRRPDCLDGVRERLRHGDVCGALDVVEGLLGPRAVLRDGPLRDELEAAAERRVAYGLFRAGLTGPGPGPNGARPDRTGSGGIPPARRRTRDVRAHPRHATR
ncbi:hypothetical protein [Streptomyces sp. NPDC060198]|uniref:hypothetical protein n=1 Tax=Streptomyces sp. NPDC060198 TaxID=3347070 RepID=UPI003654DE9A